MLAPFSSKGRWLPRWFTRCKRAPFFPHHFYHFLFGSFYFFSIACRYLPACAQDLAGYQSDLAAYLVGARPEVYGNIVDAVSALDAAVEAFPHHSPPLEQADFALASIKPAGEAVRVAVDAAEGLCMASLWPTATYQQMLLTMQNEA